MNRNIVSDTTGSITNTILRLAAVAAVIATAFLAVHQSAPRADAEDYPFVRTCTFYSAIRADFYTTTNPEQCANGVGGYNRQAEANLQLIRPDEPQRPDTVAIYNWWSQDRLDNRLIRADVTPCRNPGVSSAGSYVCVRKEGYTYKAASSTVSCAGTIAVSMSWSAANTDAAFSYSSTPPSGYVNQYALGHIPRWCLGQPRG